MRKSERKLAILKSRTITEVTLTTQVNARPNSIYIPNSLRAAGREIRAALVQPLNRMNPAAFVRAWCAVAYLYPGLHPDGYESEDSGWPRVLRRFATEAWRRADAGELTDNELYCYQACKARIRRERAEVERVAPWLFRDHFAA